MSDFISSHNRAAAFRTANGVFEVWETRTKLVKQELAAASAANDAKTIRLRALRLEKERLDAEAARNSAPPTPPMQLPIKGRPKT
ncbi:MAG: hypothetical protein J0I19_07600 [Alphaproteobacteria bacterium]|nr:hypothetical protein [Alphaproteobacteria bacterium]